MTYSLLSLCSILVFVCVHLFAEKARRFSFIAQARFLSLGSGVAIAFVFIDLLPKLDKSSAIVQKTFHGLVPFAEHHVFIMALLGFLLFYLVERTSTPGIENNRTLWLSLGSYSLFNFLMGYAVVDPYNPEVQPLLLFTFAMGLHYFANDYSLSTVHGEIYDRSGKWLLIASLLLGWIVGAAYSLPQTAVALISAFIGGGVIMNVTRHELPENSPNSLGTFLSAALLYTVLLLTVGR